MKLVLNDVCFKGQPLQILFPLAVTENSECNSECNEITSLASRLTVYMYSDGISINVSLFYFDGQPYDKKQSSKHIG